METKIITTTNKLKTLLINSDGAKSSTVQIWFKAGSSYEDKYNKGIAHFLEHMFFKGTLRKPGAKIAEEVESFKEKSMLLPHLTILATILIVLLKIH